VLLLRRLNKTKAKTKASRPHLVQRVGVVQPVVVAVGVQAGQPLVPGCGWVGGVDGQSSARVWQGPCVSLSKRLQSYGISCETDETSVIISRSGRNRGTHVCAAASNWLEWK
jgi:hypothetical protein